MAASDVTSNFGIPTPPAMESPSDVKGSFFSAAGSMIKGKGDELELPEPSILTAPPSVHDTTDGSSEPSSSPGADVPVSGGGNDTLVDANVKSSPSSANGANSSKRKRKGIPFRSPDREDLERDPGMVFCFPAVFQASINNNNNTTDGSSSPSQQESPATTNGDALQNKNTTSPAEPDVTNTNTTHNSTRFNNDTLAGPSAVIIHRPLLLPDIVRSITQARRSKMRSRPVTRAKNKRENIELELLSYGLEGIIDTDNVRNSDDPLMGSSRRSVTNADQRYMSSFSNSQISRSSASGVSASGDKKLARPSTGNNGNHSSSYYHASKKRRTSISVSSLSSIPTSELSDYELNSDNFGDDEDDPDFTLHAKKRKTEYVSSKVNHGPPTSHASHRRDSNNKTKICASCRTRSTPCWRPGWRTDLFLCNSCGLRFEIYYIIIFTSPYMMVQEDEMCVHESRVSIHSAQIRIQRDVQKTKEWRFTGPEALLQLILARPSLYG
ncbi:9471_t:CDS:2 [Acaulospora colombiana]|uniref:9471_t:CDS:1 n=1 Tax=Acaulospora colombiana TaxID=27376 RepID=A0ACA9K9N1_9GLOM|nr:9471_t:CDS:2 [Acaulospora colombiana]